MLSAETIAKKVITPRPRDIHKGSLGRVLLIGGHYPYGGAIIMAAIACVNSGAGLVSVATDKENITALHAHLPEAMAFDMSHQEHLVTAIRQSDVVLIGSGLGEDTLSKAIFKLVFETIADHQTFIIDGSALNLLARNKKIALKKHKIILTPHQKEWERLSGLKIDKQTTRNTQVALASFQNGTILVAKSQATKVYTTDRVCSIGVGGPYQATGGMGDTLAGMIAGFCAQFRDNLFETVVASTYLHSYIADMLSEDVYVVLPTQISRQIPKVMKRFESLSAKNPSFPLF
ncbi:NAD(P)H-hydrate dehydratase [Streptococcus sciuri]|uniref:ADP-dependent (S)-NAD(P)H-hydrate dehydratase n=1 Tax=Streptococcus sciuri TaxID=2973939 RepID=A0ABT2F8B5_9STRE|nr:NAD(P)H-hydrate dehydratase [Streptococcus sciuri]MCS4488085.1 NAD(P)H-hydrate dehydratase [Streptococcus sciuri]